MAKLSISDNQAVFVATLSSYLQDAFAEGVSAPSNSNVVPLMGDATNPTLTYAAIDPTKQPMVKDPFRSMAAALAKVLNIDTPFSNTVPPWIGLACNTDWQVFGYGGWQNGQYYSDSSGNVFLRGLVRRTASSSATVIATLPVGYRPTYNRLFISICDGAVVRLDVYPDGTVNLLGGTGDPTNYVSLESIHFDTR